MGDARPSQQSSPVITKPTRALSSSPCPYPINALPASQALATRSPSL